MTKFTINRWLGSCPEIMKSCPSCKTRADERDFRKIYADKIVSDTVDKSDFDAMKIELQEFKKQAKNLKTLGVVYAECKICDTPFSNNEARNAHMTKYHK